MKKIFLSIICLTLAFTITACGTASKKNSDKDGKIVSEAKEKQKNSKSNSKKKAETPPTKVADDSGDSSNKKSKSNKIDIDLSNLNSNVVYAQVTQMMMDPNKFIGKRIRMSGQFIVYDAKPGNESGASEYYAIIIADALACCQQGIEFIWPGHSYPDGFPQLKSNATVTGIFQVYKEDGKKYCRLVAETVEQL